MNAAAKAPQPGAYPYRITYYRNGRLRTTYAKREMVRGFSELVDANGRVLRVTETELKINGRFAGVRPTVFVQGAIEWRNGAKPPQACPNCGIATGAVEIPVDSSSNPNQ